MFLSCFQNIFVFVLSIEFWDFSDNLESFLVILGVECNLLYLCVLSARL